MATGHHQTAGSATPDTKGSIRLALARAVLYRSLKLGLRFPDRETEVLFSPEGNEALLQAARAIDDHTGGALLEAAERLCCLGDPSLGERQSLHQDLFGHTLRGKVCPYETEYGRLGTFRQSQELADLAGFYLAFGLRPAEQEAERPDHVACELEYQEFLSCKEAYALDVGDTEMLDVTRNAMRKFMRDHLGRFGRAFGLTLAREDEEGFYGSLATVLVEFIFLECSRMSVPLGPQVLELADPEADNVPMACGSKCGLESP